MSPMPQRQNFSGMQAEFAPGVIRGIRAWQLNPFSFGGLCGLSYPIPWGPGENRAECYRSTGVSGVFPSVLPHHRAPEPECTCGFYAFFAGGHPELDYVGPSIAAYGVIEAYGNVLIGTKGFRAEKARIVALTTRDSNGVAAVINRYSNIPLFPTFDKMIAEFPPDLPDSVSEREGIHE